MKKIWITSLASSEEIIKKLMGQLKTYGLMGTGHFWEDDLKKMAWIKPRGEILASGVAAWAIIGADSDFKNPDLRYGLSMLALAVRAARGPAFPIVVLQTTGDALVAEDLPTPLKSVDVLPLESATLGPKLVAKAHTPAGSPTTPDYRLDVYGHEHIGQWFEVGPRSGNWNGGMFAVSGAEILFHAVGPGGQLPEKTVLNFQTRDMKLELKGSEYTAWAVQNPIDADTSYFVKVEGAPDAVLFGPNSEEEDAELFVLSLK